MKEAFEKIIERLEEEVCYQQKCRDGVKGVNRTTITQAREKMKECYEHAIEIVNQVAEEYSNSEIPNMSENLASSDGWIPVSERLPETEEPCWITFEDAEGKLHVCEDIYCDYGGWYETEDTAVKAWMYVNAPAPYQPKGEK